jgi:holin-like protein
MSAMPVLRPQIFRSLLHSGWPLLRGVLQVGLLSALWVAMEAVRAHFGWGMPAGLIGFALLATGLFSGLVKARWMLLFFVPAMLVVTEYTGLIQHQGLRILAVIVASTACVMAATALAVDRVYRLELWLARRRSTRAGLRREQA